MTADTAMTTDTATVAATIRAQAPGRIEREDHDLNTSNLDSARAIRDTAPGRTAPAHSAPAHTTR